MKHNNRENRLFSTELRAEEDSRKIVGYAAIFDTLSENLGGFREKIQAGAFNEVLNDDVRALVNHDANLILARSPQTMSLSVDEKGLRYEFDAPNTTAGNDLMENIRLGNINQSSFGFTIEDDKWDEDDEGRVIRTIIKVKRLYDVSPVTYPAYPDTTVAKRSLEEFEKAKEPEEEQPKPKNDLRDLQIYLLENA